VLPMRTLYTLGRVALCWDPCIITLMLITRRGFSSPPVAHPCSYDQSTIPLTAATTEHQSTPLLPACCLPLYQTLRWVYAVIGKPAMIGHCVGAVSGPLAFVVKVRCVQRYSTFSAVAPPVWRCRFAVVRCSLPPVFPATLAVTIASSCQTHVRSLCL
jgi:hypothetical protein